VLKRPVRDIRPLPTFLMAGPLQAVPFSEILLLAGKIETFPVECIRSKHLISDRVRFKSQS